MRSRTPRSWTAVACPAPRGASCRPAAPAPLAELVPLARRWGAILLLDDAHGTGTLGATGRGTPELFGVAGEIDVWTGTLGKALGSFRGVAPGGPAVRGGLRYG